MLLGARESGIFWGGYDGAERKRLLFLPEWMAEPDGTEIAAVRAACRSGGDLTHRDFLGSLMALGLTREKIGDILVEKGGCQVLLDPSHDGFPAAELGQRRPGEAHRNAAAAFGAGRSPMRR